MPSISKAISQRSQGLSWGHLNQVVCLLAFRLWPARRCAQATACAPLPAWLRGEFDAAGSHLEAATADFASASDHHQIEAVWFQPDDPIATAYLHLALTCLARGDLTDAEAELAYAARRVEAQGFPQGPYSHAYARFVESWLRIQAGQLDRARALAAELTELAERHALDHWRRTGSIQQSSSALWPHSMPTTSTRPRDRPAQQPSPGSSTPGAPPRSTCTSRSSTAPSGGC